VIGGIALLVVLVRDHHISTVSVIIFGSLIPSIILHEISHGWVALAFGDDTAKRAGRLTLNPIPHIDPVGTIVVPVIMALSGIGFLGWAKPVPVNVGRLRSPRNQTVLVSLAGPFTNVVLATIAGIVLVAGHGMYEFGPNVVSFKSTLYEVLFYFGLVNIGLAVFNMIPVPPLDGSAVVERLIPRSWWPAYLRYRQYTMPLLLMLVILNSYMHPGPITWLFDHVETWWVNLVAQHA
jgi:Zn-dependent protease